MFDKKSSKSTFTESLTKLVIIPKWFENVFPGCNTINKASCSHFLKIFWDLLPLISAKLVQITSNFHRKLYLWSYISRVKVIKIETFFAHLAFFQKGFCLEKWKKNLFSAIFLQNLPPGFCAWRVQMTCDIQWITSKIYMICKVGDHSTFLLAWHSLKKVISQ